MGIILVYSCLVIIFNGAYAPPPNRQKAESPPPTAQATDDPAKPVSFNLKYINYLDKDNVF